MSDDNGGQGAALPAKGNNGAMIDAFYDCIECGHDVHDGDLSVTVSIPEWNLFDAKLCGDCAHIVVEIVRSFRERNK